MSPVPSSDTIKRLQQLAGVEAFLWLYEVEVPTSPQTRYRFVGRHPTSVQYRGNTYYPAPISHEAAGDDTEGNLPEATISIGNATRELMETLETYSGLVGQPVRILLVHRSQLLSGEAIIEQDFTIADVSADENAVSARLALYNAYRTRFPSRRLTRGFCRFQYRSAECGYAVPIADDGLETCDKSLDGPNGCEVHGASEVAAGFAQLHPARFGGAPGIPRPPTGGVF